MKSNYISRPVGLTPAVKIIEEVCSNSEPYKRCGMRPDHMILNLDPGSGRTTFMEYMSAMYQSYHIIDMLSGPDPYLEIAFDGSLQQLRQAFFTIDAAAVYTNEFSNILSMDITNLAKHLNELQFSEFIKECKEVCDSACVVFFVSSEPSKSEERLIKKLCESISPIRRITLEPYTKEELSEIIKEKLDSCGLTIDETQDFDQSMSEIIESFDIDSIEKALDLSDKLVFSADFSSFEPIIDKESLNYVKTLLRR